MKSFGLRLYVADGKRPFIAMEGINLATEAEHELAFD
jgi:hypothetical protein